MITQELKEAHLAPEKKAINSDSQLSHHTAHDSFLPGIIGEALLQLAHHQNYWWPVNDAAFFFSLPVNQFNQLLHF